MNLLLKVYQAKICSQYTILFNYSLENLAFLIFSLLDNVNRGSASLPIVRMEVHKGMLLTRGEFIFSRIASLDLIFAL